MSIAVNTGSARGVTIPTTLAGTPIVQAAPTAADRPATAVAQPPANRFAELLRRNRAEAPKPAVPAAVHAPRTDSAAGAEAGDTSAIEATAAPANADKARAATAKETSDKSLVHDGARGGEKSNAASGAEGTDRGDDGDRKGPAAAAAPADRPDSRAQVTLDALRPLATAVAPATDAATGSAGDDRDASATGAAGAGTRNTLGHARGMAAVDAANDHHASLIGLSRDTALGVAADAPLQVARGEALPAAESSAARAAHERALDALTASLGIGAPSPSAPPATPLSASTVLALPTPVDAADFASALGVRVSVLVRDGVQQAELHLNPPETGPVSIHITLDGSAARVDFGADVAATRAAIERGLPELASALRDAGFTLAGGGVSQHAGGRASSDDSARASARVEGSAGPISASAATESRRVVRSVAAGGIDLYA